MPSLTCPREANELAILGMHVQGERAFQTELGDENILKTIDIDCDIRVILSECNIVENNQLSRGIMIARCENPIFRFFPDVAKRRAHDW
jgi:hypothetical protein